MRRLLLILVFVFSAQIMSAQTDPDPRLFQTWYLYAKEYDMGDIVMYDGPNPPQLTINQDLSFTGIEDCALISGSFIYGEGGGHSTFELETESYETDESGCTSGPPTYAIPELGFFDITKYCELETGTDGIDYFQFESYAGFYSYFRNTLILSIPHNTLESFVVYPNPTSDILFLKSNDMEIQKVSIFDINGRLVLSMNDNTIQAVDVSKLSPGMYFIQMRSSTRLHTHKFIKN